MKKTLPIVFAVIMLVSAVAHFVVPSAYEPLIPDFFPPLAANIFVGVCELAIGLLLLSPQYRSLGGLGFAILMIGFMPLHIWDLLRDAPMIKPYVAAVIRVVIQVWLIYAGWRIFRVNRKN